MISTKGKTITLLVGSTAGGGFDLYARTLARFLGAHIPGNPTVIVQNMPGAGSLTSVLHLDNGAPRDGTYMTIFNAGILTEAITNPAEAKVDFRKVNWIGSHVNYIIAQNCTPIHTNPAARPFNHRDRSLDTVVLM